MASLVKAGVEFYAADKLQGVAFESISVFVPVNPFVIIIEALSKKI